ncbi:hypothetical protein RSAG8_13173, partial [Rhizoctonia solani AG-8 WAC10335]
MSLGPAYRPTHRRCSRSACLKSSSSITEWFHFPYKLSGNFPILQNSRIHFLAEAAAHFARPMAVAANIDDLTSPHSSASESRSDIVIIHIRLSMTSSKDECSVVPFLQRDGLVIYTNV